jgi:GR25 family glycosyltransferase involved in LPS biosynthesis
MKADKIYIVHWNQLKDRKKYLTEQLSIYEPLWVDFYDRNTITDDIINKYYSKDKDLWYNRVVNLYKDAPEYRDLKISEICNSLSHIYAINDMCKNDKQYGLILEDDVILKDNFFQKFDYYFDNTPEDFDIIFLGTSFSTQILDSVGFDNDKPAIHIKPNVYVYEKHRNPKTRCVDAYVINKSACERLTSIMDNISLPFDFDLAYFIKELNLKVYWWEPGLVYQGSQSGRYGSSIR